MDRSKFVRYSFTYFNMLLKKMKEKEMIVLTAGLFGVLLGGWTLSNPAYEESGRVANPDCMLSLSSSGLSWNSVPDVWPRLLESVDVTEIRSSISLKAD